MTDVRLPVYTAGSEDVVGYVTGFVIYGGTVEPIVEIADPA